MEFNDRIARASLHVEVADRVREMIFDRTLAPGLRIDELDLSARLGTSRTPLREALKVLANEGLVRLAPGRGAYVTELSAPEVESLFPVLAMLEARCAGEAVRRLGLHPVADVRDRLDAGMREQAQDLRVMLGADIVGTAAADEQGGTAVALAGARLGKAHDLGHVVAQRLQGDAPGQPVLAAREVLQQEAAHAAVLDLAGEQRVRLGASVDPGEVEIAHRLDIGVEAAAIGDRRDVDHHQAQDLLATLQARFPDQTLGSELPELPAAVRLDLPRLLQAVAALLEWAASRNPAGGTLLLRGELDERCYRLAVESRTAVVDPGSLSQVFQPALIQAKAELPARLELSLYLAQEVARGHGGSLIARLDDGRLRFLLTLPTALD